MLDIQGMITSLRKRKPVIHCITNYVTANDCANILLAIGASPIMADAMEEVEEVTGICNGLVLNTGTLQSNTTPSMFLSAHKANEKGIPIILDPVGIGVSEFRTNHIYKLIKQCHITVIRGNATEIMSLARNRKNESGIDVDQMDEINAETLEYTIVMAKKLRDLTGAVIVVTGKVDLIIGEQIYLIHHGHEMMRNITGMGCMLTAVIAAFCTVEKVHFEHACALAVGMFGLAGEIAYQRMVTCNQSSSQKESINGEFSGIGTYHMHFMDAVSRMSEELLGGIKVEVR